MSDDLLARLQAAGSAEERGWLVTDALLESLPAELRQAAWAAAVPHWFDAEILAALLEKAPGSPGAEENAALYAELQGLPFVEPFEGRGGHNVHEVTRAAMLARLWDERRDEYRALSARAVAYFAGSDEAERRIEEIYHQLIADPDAGTEALSEQGWAWHDPPAIAYDLVYALAGAALEHAGAGRLDRRAAGTANLLSGRIDTLYSRIQEAKDKLEAARRASDPDSQLRADSNLRLGDVHWMIGEYTEARARFVVALTIYTATSDLWGQATCLLGLGDVHLSLDEYAEARGRYQEALSIYATIADRRGQAHCIKSLGSVHYMLAEYADAQDRYQEARRIYAATGNRLMEAHSIQALGDVHRMLEEYREARERYEEALPIYTAIGDRLGEANVTLGLGDVARVEKDWPEAERLFEAALAVYRETGMLYNTGLALRRLGGVAEDRGDRSGAARYYEEALEIFEGIGVKDAEWDRADLARVRGEEEDGG